MCYGWVEDPEPLEWLMELEFSRGEMVQVVDIEELEDRTGVVIGYDTLGDGGSHRYRVSVNGEEVSWMIERQHLLSTGMINENLLPVRVRPVLADGTVVMLLDTPETRSLGLAGEVALTDGLWWQDTSAEPAGYAIRIPGGRESYVLPFGAFEPVKGRGGDGPSRPT